MYTLSIQYRCLESKKALFAEYLKERYPAAVVSIGHNQSPCYTTIQGLRLEDLVLGFMDGITVLSIRIIYDPADPMPDHETSENTISVYGDLFTENLIHNLNS